MRLSEFTYHLPEELIAQTPLADRAQARLMVVDRRTKEIRHDRFFNIGKYLPPQSVLVLNTSKVVAARLLGHKLRSGGQVEILLLKQLEDPHCFHALLRPMSKIRPGDVVAFPGTEISAEVVDVPNRIVRFSTPHLPKLLTRLGHMPLPPYIRRPDTPEDRVLYQTVYAREQGSVAAPTAGLHFTEELLRQLQEDGHDVVKLCLHINHGTFQLVEAQDITQHTMHSEDYVIPVPTLRKVDAARRQGRAAVAVGTTSCRALESWAKTGQMSGSTDLFVYPGYAFQMVDALITNFHFPQSSLLMLVHAFGTPELMKRAYAEAVRQRYRFYSYGDAMVIV